MPPNTPKKSVTQFFQKEIHVADEYSNTPVNELKDRAHKRRKLAEEKYFDTERQVLSPILTNNIYDAWLGNSTVNITGYSTRDIIIHLISMTKTHILKDNKPSNAGEIDAIYKDIQHNKASIQIGRIKFCVDLDPSYAHTGNGRILKLGHYGLLNKHGAPDKKAVLSIINRITGQDSEKEKALAEILLNFTTHINEITDEELLAAGLNSSRKERDAEKITIVAFLFTLFEVFRRKLPGYKYRNGELKALEEHAFAATQHEALDAVAKGKLRMSDIFNKPAPYCIVTYKCFDPTSQSHKTIGETLKLAPERIDQEQDKMDRFYIEKTIDDFKELNLDGNGNFILTAKGYRKYALGAAQDEDDLLSLRDYDSDEYEDVTEINTKNLSAPPAAIIVPPIPAPAAVPAAQTNINSPKQDTKIRPTQSANSLFLPPLPVNKRKQPSNDIVTKSSNGVDDLLLPLSLLAVTGTIGYKLGGENHKLLGTAGGLAAGAAILWALNHSTSEPKPITIPPIPVNNTRYRI